MTATDEKIFPGLTESILQVCDFLGLKLPPSPVMTSKEIFPSDYFGKNFELNPEAQEKDSIEKRVSSLISELDFE